MIDSHIHHGNKLGIDPSSITWPRTLDMNDRSLRKIVTSLGGKANGTPREAGFVITAASEIMAILALANSRADLRRRLSDIAIGYDTSGKLLRAGDIGGIGALMVLLNDAIMPNLVQTTENVPAFVHCGPFGNIAHGTSSVVSQKMALQLADFVVNEAGFASDLGAEKYFDIVSPATGIKPAAAVLVTTVRSIEAQGAEHGHDEGLPALRRGFANLGRHMENLGVYGVPFVVALNRFPGDTQEKLDYVRDFIKERGADSALSEVFTRGGEGGTELAEKVATLAKSPQSESARQAMQPLYTPSVSLEGKIETIAHEVYGAGRIYIESTARKKLKKFTDLGFGNLPICMAKTQSSITDDPKLLGAPTGWTLTVTDANLSAGAGFIVVIAGNMLLMPGLPEAPQAMQMDVDDDGNITGLR
jgi:formate--tetrahydrofolate ligase